MQAQPTLTVTVSLELEVDERAWAVLFGSGDGYDEALAQRRRSLVADVEDYVFCQIIESAARHEGAIVDVDLWSSPRKPKRRGS